MGRYQNILIEAIMNLGDLVALTAVIPLIKKKNPTCEVRFLVKPGFDDLLDNVPGLNGYIVYGYKSGRGIGGVWKLSQLLKSYQFDCFISYDSRKRTEIAAFLARIPNRFTVGSVFGWNTRTHLFTQRSDFTDYNLDTHRTAEAFLEATKRMLDISLNIKNKTYIPLVRSKRKSALIDFEKYIVISIATKSIERSWATANWIKLMNYLLQHSNTNIIIVGVQDDFEQANEVLQSLVSKERVKNLCGKTSLGELIEVLSHSDICVNIDNGIGHLAAALQRGTVTLFPTANPQRFLPVGPASLAVSKDKQGNIDVESVCNAIIKSL